LPSKPLLALSYSVLIWVVGFIWGSVVFMTPELKAVKPIPYISSNPAISFPILMLWIPLTYILARSYLKRTERTSTEGIKLGFNFAVVNFILDLVILVFLLKAGFGYFVSLSVWFAYTMLLLLPWFVGRSVGVGTTPR
jgi:hypothetical protein